MSFIKLHSRLTVVLAGLVVATLAALVFNTPSAHAANPKWLNRQDIVWDGVVYRDPNTLDTDITYNELTTRLCKNKISIVSVSLPNGIDQEFANKIFYFDSNYSNPNITRRFIKSTEFTSQVTNKPECRNEAPQDNLAIDDIPNRRITFYNNGAGKIINLINGATFSATGTVTSQNIPRFTSDADIAAGDICIDMILLRTGNNTYFQESSGWGGGNRPDSSIMYIVSNNSSLGRTSQSYDLITDLASVGRETCKVDSGKLNNYAMLNYSNGGSGSDRVLLSSGIDAAGNTDPNGEEDDDAFLVFIGSQANVAVDPTTGGQIPPPAAPPVTALQPVCEDEASGLAHYLCPIINSVQSAVQFLFDHVIRPFLGITPAASVQNLQAVWSSVLVIANIAFILVFFIIIFSQATSIGVSNYGIKRMLPRLIIVAILANLSFYICSFAIDFANILGAGVSSLILIPIQNLGGPTFRITGGLDSLITTVGALSFTGAALAASGGIMAGIFALVVAVAIGLLILVLLLVLRQVLIFTFVVFSPLIFIGFILPGTARMSGTLTRGFLNLLWIGPVVMATMALSGLIIIIIQSIPL